MTIFPQAPKRDEEVLPFLRALMAALRNFSRGSSSANLADQLSEVRSIPIGGLLAWSTNIVPSGFLLCDGSTYLKTSYASLYEVIGDIWAIGGEAPENFRVPNFIGRSVVHPANVNDISNLSGNNQVTIAQANLPDYNLQVSDPGHAHSAPISDEPILYSAGAGSTTAGSSGSTNTGNASTGITVSLNGGGQALDITPSQVAVPWIIRAL